MFKGNLGDRITIGMEEELLLVVDESRSWDEELSW